MNLRLASARAKRRLDDDTVDSNHSVADNVLKAQPRPWQEYVTPRTAKPTIDYVVSPSTDSAITKGKPLRICVLFDGAGLARLGLEQAGHECVGFELNPVAHWLSTHVGSGSCRLMDVRNLTAADLREFDAVWASPPCQSRSSARTQGPASGVYADDLLEYSLCTIREKAPQLQALWVENVVVFGQAADNLWGHTWNAAQFYPELRRGVGGIGQNRNRVVGGFYPLPQVQRPYRRTFEGICPCVTASEFKGCATDKRRASRFYGRKLTVSECASRMGLSVPDAWLTKPTDELIFNGSDALWQHELYRAIGNGVPVPMARAFGAAAFSSH